MYAWRDVDRHTLPVDDKRFHIDGQSLGWYGAWMLADNITVGAPQAATSYQEIPGRAAADLSLEDAAGSTPLERRELTVPLVTAGDRMECRETLAKLTALTGRTVSVEDREWEGSYEGRVETVDTEWRPDAGAILITLTMSCDPLLYGWERSKALVAGANVIAHEGNRPTPPVLELSAVKNATKITVTDGTRTWSITPAKPYAGGERLVVDCDTQHATVNGNPIAPDLVADWPLLTGKQTTITLTGATGRVRWRPRILTS